MHENLAVFNWGEPFPDLDAVLLWSQSADSRWWGVVVVGEAEENFEDKSASGFLAQTSLLNTIVLQPKFLPLYPNQVINIFKFLSWH